MSEKRISETLKTGDTIRLPSKKMIRSKYTKKFLETKVQELSLTLNRKPTLNEFVDKYRLELGEIEKIYPEPNRVLKAGRISLLNRTI